MPKDGYQLHSPAYIQAPGANPRSDRWRVSCYIRSNLPPSLILVMLMSCFSAAAAGARPHFRERILNGQGPFATLASDSLGEGHLPSTALEVQCVDRLQKSLGSIRTRARIGRFLGGPVLFGLGAAMVFEGFDEENTISDRQLLGSIGGTICIGSAAFLLSKRDYERLPARFRAMPETTLEDLQEKRKSGEVYLTQLASNGKRDRMILGLAWLALCLVPQAISENGDPAVGAAWGVGGLVLELALKSYEERQLDAYNTFLRGHDK